MVDHSDEIRELRDRMDRQHASLKDDLIEHQLANERRFAELQTALAAMNKLMIATSGTIITVLTALQILGVL